MDSVSFFFFNYFIRLESKGVEYLRAINGKKKKKNMYIYWLLKNDQAIFQMRWKNVAQYVLVLMRHVTLYLKKLFNIWVYKLYRWSIYISSNKSF